ncbi:MAG: COX15/CtaA family protein [Betaproteobacteria bacterium]
MGKLPGENQGPVATWLFVCTFLVFAMVIIGGLTRLTQSGLSMVEWEPIMGTIPPISDSDWNDVFDKYKTSPEYQKVNFGMSLSEFKEIFWLEYIHRVFGRLIGLVFFIPFIYFLIRKKIDASLTLRLAGIFALGGLQAGMGWYMVKSGLVDDPRVSQFRLTSHLGLAILIFGTLLWTALSVMYPSKANVSPHQKNVLIFSRILNGLIFVMILSGGFVAGIRAGLAYNTFPLMGDGFIPPDIFVLTPWWQNFFSNMATVQFDHRLLAYTLSILIPVFWWKVNRRDVSPRAKLAVNVLLGLFILQIIIGISTLLLHVPVAFASAHQATAVLVFGTSLWVTHSLSARRGMI